MTEANEIRPLNRPTSMAEKLSQFVKEVVNFSSQYGTQGSHSYTACNLEGELRIYDGYGDRTEAFVLVSIAVIALSRLDDGVFYPTVAYIRTLVAKMSICSSEVEEFRDLQESRFCRLVTPFSLG